MDSLSFASGIAKPTSSPVWRSHGFVEVFSIDFNKYHDKSLVSDLPDRFPEHKKRQQQKPVCGNLTGRYICNNNKNSASHGLRNDCGRRRLRQILDQLDHAGIQLDFVEYSELLRGCIVLADGIRVHAHIIKSGHEPDGFLGNLLVSMYAKCGSLENARSVFDQMCRRDVVSWNAMIGAYAQHDHGKEALQLFQQMQQGNLKPDRITFISVLRACASLGALPEGKLIHACVVDSGFESNVVVGTALINLYGKCGSLKEAHAMFGKMHQRNVVSWNAMIAAYAQHEHGKEALEQFRQMQLEGVKPDKVTFLSVISACASLADLAEGKAIHAHVIDNGLELDTVVGSALVNMYGKCGSVEDSWATFEKMHQQNAVQDVVSWNVMIAAYAQHGNGKEALEVFRQMQQEGMEPNKITFISVVDACASLAALAEGKVIHARIIDAGYELDVVVRTALVNLYGNCGNLEHARMLFDRMHTRNVVSWNSMITAYGQEGFGKEAMQLFHQMLWGGVKPNKVTFVSVLSACASLAALAEGKVIHASVVDGGFESDVVVGTALVNMYGKCGSLKDARAVFDKMHHRDGVSWNAMIASHAQHGLGKEVLKLFRQMQSAGVKPNETTFVSILSACSHAGLVDEGHCYFISMSEDHGIAPTLEHYGCMIDLLGRAGQLDDAESLISKMPLQPNAMVWETLLGACRIHGDIERGKRIAEHVIELNQTNPAPYVLLSNIYAANGSWDDVATVRKMMARREEVTRMQLN